MKRKQRAYYAEELIGKGLDPKNLTIELAYSILYDYKLHSGFADVLSAMGLAFFSLN
jgi:hypothetical protein